MASCRWSDNMSITHTVLVRFRAGPLNLFDVFYKSVMPAAWPLSISDFDEGTPWSNLTVCANSQLKRVL